MIKFFHLIAFIGYIASIILFITTKDVYHGVWAMLLYMGMEGMNRPRIVIGQSK